MDMNTRSDATMYVQLHNARRSNLLLIALNHIDTTCRRCSSVVIANTNGRRGDTQIDCTNMVHLVRVSSYRRHFRINMNHDIMIEAGLTCCESSEILNQSGASFGFGRVLNGLKPPDSVTELDMGVQAEKVYQEHCFR